MESNQMPLVDTEAELRALMDRKKKLKKLIDLQGEVAAMEMKLLMGNADFIVTTRKIAEIVCEHYRVPLSAMAGPCRDARLVNPRHVIFYLAKRNTGISAAAVGRMFSRDHVTVLHALKRVEALMQTEPKFKAEVEQIEERCLAKIREETAGGKSQMATIQSE